MSVRYLFGGDEIATPLPFPPDEEAYQPTRPPVAFWPTAVAALFLLGIAQSSYADEVPPPASAPIVDEDYGFRTLRPTMPFYANIGGSGGTAPTSITAEDDAQPLALEVAGRLARALPPIIRPIIADDDIVSAGFALDDDLGVWATLAPWTMPPPPRILLANDEIAAPLTVEETEPGPLPPPEIAFHTVVLPWSWDDGTDFAQHGIEDDPPPTFVRPQTGWVYPPLHPIVADDEIASTSAIAVEADEAPRLLQWRVPAIPRPVTDDDVITVALRFDDEPSGPLAKAPILPQPRVMWDDEIIAFPPAPIVEEDLSDWRPLAGHWFWHPRQIAPFDAFEFPPTAIAYPVVPYLAFLLDTAPRVELLDTSLRVLLIDLEGNPIMTQTLPIKRGSAARVRAIISADSGLDDLAGYAVRFHLRKKGSKTTLLDVAATLEAPTTDRIVRADLTSAQTDLTPGTYVGEWWLQLGAADPIKAPGEDYLTIQISDDIDALP